MLVHLLCQFPLSLASCSLGMALCNLGDRNMRSTLWSAPAKGCQTWPVDIEEVVPIRDARVVYWSWINSYFCSNALYKKTSTKLYQLRIFLPSCRSSTICFLLSVSWQSCKRHSRRWLIVTFNVHPYVDSKGFSSRTWVKYLIHCFTNSMQL